MLVPQTQTFDTINDFQKLTLESKKITYAYSIDSS